MDAGDVLVDRYRLLDRLGVGGMSVVWRAHDQVLRRDVAVKVLAVGHTSRSLPPDAIRSEAQAAAKLAHPHVANVFDYGEITDGTDAPVPFVVMELLHGTTLAALTVDGPLSPDVALRACAEVAGALAEAHAHGLVHRDVKPGNVMMTAGGAKVFDFGIAVAIGTLDAGSEAPVFGTPAYIAPERIIGGEASPASDVYALGVLLYRLLTHEYPWPAGAASHMLLAHVYGEARDLPAIDGVPDSVRALYKQCVAKEPTDRPTAAAAAGVLAAAAPTRVLSMAGPPKGGAPAGRGIGRRRRGRLTLRAGLAVAAVAVAAAASTVALAGLAGRPGPAPGPTQAAPPATGPTVPAPAESPPVAGSSLSAAASGGDPLSGPAPADPLATTSPAPLAPTGTAPPSPTATTGTFSSAGGTVVAGCDGNRAYLASWQAATGFRVQKVNPGPGDQADVAFRQQSTEVRMVATCPAGTPTVATEYKTPPGQRVEAKASS